MSRILFSLIASLAMLSPTLLQAEILSEDLASSWRITLVDSPAASQPDTDDGRWSQVDFPDDVGAQVNTKGDWIWVRRSISVDPQAGVYSVRFERLFGKAEVFLDGRPARLLRRTPDAGALYLLPSVDTAGQHTLALRLAVRRGMPVGADGAIMLADVRKGYTDYYYEEIVTTSLALFYAGAGIFLLALSRQLKKSVYARASYFYLLLGLIGIGKSPFVLGWLPEAASNLTLYMLQSLTILLPVPLLFFARDSIERVEDRIQRTVLRLALPISALLVAVHFLLHTVQLNAAALWLHHIFFLALLPLWVGLALLVLRETARNMNISGFMMLAGFVYFLYAGITSLIAGSFFRQYFAATTLYYAPAALMPFAMLLTSMLLAERRIQRQNRQLAFLNSEMSQSRLFGYIADALDTPMRATIDLLSPSITNEQKKGVLTQLERYENRLDDLLELGRLELLEEAESTVTIPAADFLQTILPGTGISHTVHVDPDLLIDTSLELVNSALIRLIRFPGFATFDHIDLIVTEDLNERLHFRFLMHHRDRKQLRHIQDIISERLPDAEGLWIEWNIIRETIRLLHGRLSARTLSGKYLSLDLSLPAVHQKKEKAAGPAPLTLTFLHTDDTPPAPQKRMDWKERIRKLLQKEIA